MQVIFDCRRRDICYGNGTRVKVGCNQVIYNMQAIHGAQGPRICRRGRESVLVLSAPEKLGGMLRKQR